MLVTGNAVLLVTSALTISGSGRIELLPGASLQLYVGAPSASLGGNGVINPNGATAFVYYGLPSHTALSVSAPSSLTGCIYAPAAQLSSMYTSFHGAIVARGVVLQSHQSVHYDEALQRSGPFIW